jgi:tetrahydromethanopterin S-methyltransferase subunit G
MAISDREFGELLGKVNAMKDDLQRVEKNVEGLDVKVDGILGQISQVAGGMRVAIWFSGIIGGGVVFAATKVIPLFLGTLPKI